MYKTLAIGISIILEVLGKTVPVGNKTYAELVKEKGELFKQINEAIQESITVFKKSNDTEAVLGIEYMNQLREQLKEINGTDVQNLKNDTGSGTRRRNKVFITIDDVNHILRNKDKNKKEKKRAEENMMMGQKELDVWLHEQELAKDKKKNKKKIFINLEKCPRWGVDKKKKKKRSKRRQDGGPTADQELNPADYMSLEKTTKKVPQTKYPCCRKCCKRSYMGCL